MTLPIADQKIEAAYYSLDDADASIQSAKAVEAYSTIAHNDTFRNLQPNVSGRPGLGRDDWGEFRSTERIPQRYDEILKFADNIYHNFGIVSNTIDLMSDFVCHGIRISHPQPSIQRFYREWFDKVNGIERSERFVNYLYRLGTVVVRRMTAKVPMKTRKEMAKASPDLDPIRFVNPSKFELPWRFVFLHPGNVVPKDNALSGFVSQPRLQYKPPTQIYLNAQKNLDALKDVPIEVRKALEEHKPIDLDPAKTSIYYYRKDDWSNRPLPMLYPIFRNIIMLEKLYLADLAALDGAISKVRVWKLGSMEHKIQPTAAAAAKLNSILQASLNAGSADIIWGPDLELIESNTEVHRFLGEEKYRPHLNQIYAGLGIPTTLTNQGSGTTNNFISLKTLLRRLEYSRKILTGFWQEEIVRVQKAMGFAKPGKIEYRNMTIGDEEAIKGLLIQLADRNLISDELLQYEFDYDGEMEQIRLRKEHKERKGEKRVPKSGPYHDPESDIAKQKIALQKGYVTPQQVDVPINEDVEEKENPFEKQLEIQKQRNAAPTKDNARNQQTGPNGRPKGSKDKEKRSRQFKPRLKAALEVWASEAQNIIKKTVNPVILASLNKSRWSELTREEAKNAEIIKFSVLSNIAPFSVLDEVAIQEAFVKPISDSFVKNYESALSEISEAVNKNLTQTDKQQIQISLYGELNGAD